MALRAASRHGVPVVPRGAGSGLSGGANAVDGCIVLSLERMADIVHLDPDSLTATVQPGVVNAALGEAARQAGLWYPPDPASYEFSTIGGNVATNAGGKGVVGYDLAALLCGSEGTLGVVTEVTVRLAPPPRAASTLAASFPDLEGAGEAITRIVRERRPSPLELMDRTTVRAVEAIQPMDLDGDAAALLFARSDEGFHEIEWMAERCEQAGATLVVTSDEEAEGRMILAARRLAYSGATATCTRRSSTTHRDADEVARARAAFAAIVELALRLGGTATGEHGVGLLKRPFVAAELGDALPLHRAIKAALDPRGLLNPGKGP